MYYSRAKPTLQTSVPQIYVLFQILKLASSSQIYVFFQIFSNGRLKSITVSHFLIKFK
jgi:hypothetical protein